MAEVDESAYRFEANPDRDVPKSLVTSELLRSHQDTLLVRTVLVRELVITVYKRREGWR